MSTARAPPRLARVRHGAASIPGDRPGHSALAILVKAGAGGSRADPRCRDGAPRGAARAGRLGPRRRVAAAGGAGPRDLIPVDPPAWGTGGRSAPAGSAGAGPITIDEGLGRRPDALRVCERCRAALAATYAVAPSPETGAAYAALRQRRERARSRATPRRHPARRGAGLYTICNRGRAMLRARQQPAGHPAVEEHRHPPDRLGGPGLLRPAGQGPAWRSEPWFAVCDP
jgi:hypothetical protein